MGVSEGIGAWLRKLRHDVVHLREEGLHQLPDVDIFAKALGEGRVILTFDLDFGEILALSGGRTVSVVLFRLNNTRTPFVKKRLEAVLPKVEEALLNGAIVVVEDGRHRVRRLPLGS